MNTVLYLAPTEEPVTLSELKLHCRIEQDQVDEDEYLERAIILAREYVESYTRRQLITATWDLFLDQFPDCGFIKMPFGKLQSVTSMKYKDYAGTETTMSSTTGYLVDTNKEPGRIFLPYGTPWPSSTLYPSSPISIRFECGYGDTADTVDQTIKQAILLVAGDAYEHRESQIIMSGGIQAYENKAVERLLWTRRLWI